MRLLATHAKYVADRVALELLNCGFVTLTEGIEPVVKVAEEIILDDIEFESEIVAKANELLEERDDEIEFLQIDRKELFWMIKKKVAEEESFNIRWDDRLGDISHHILDELYEEDLINYSVSENRVKSVIFDAIEGYLKRQDKIEDSVHEKMKSYKRRLMYGTDEYEIVYNKLYEEELRKLGL